MKVNELDNLWVGYNKTEDFRVLICALDTEEAKEIVDNYCFENNLNGSFQITKFNDINIEFNCDYVLII